MTRFLENTARKKQAEGKHYYVILGHIQKKVLRVIYSILKNRTAYKMITT